MKTASYSHANILSCIFGKEGPGVRIFLRKSPGCEGGRYPYLEIDIQQLPTQTNKRIFIGEDNWAFRCLDPREACEQARSGEVVFDSYEDKNARGEAGTRGQFILKFRGSETESGDFNFDCYGPCA